VLISTVTTAEVHDELLKRGEVLVKGDLIRARQVANQIALRDAIEKYQVKKVFSFHSSVASAQSFVSKGSEGIGTHLGPDFECHTLQTLKEQDEVLAELVREIVARKVKGYDDARLRDHVLFREPAIAPKVPLELLMEAIRVRCIDGLLSVFEQRWQENYQERVRRKAERCDCNVPYYEDPELHRWQVEQRVKHKNASWLRIGRNCSMTSAGSIGMRTKLPGSHLFWS